MWPIVPVTVSTNCFDGMTRIFIPARPTETANDCEVRLLLAAPSFTVTVIVADPIALAMGCLLYTSRCV